MVVSTDVLGDEFEFIVPGTRRNSRLLKSQRRCARKRSKSVET